MKGILSVCLCCLLFPIWGHAQPKFVDRLEAVLNQDDRYTLQLIDQLLHLETQYPEQSGRIQLELSRVYIRIKNWPAAKAALNKVRARPNLPSAVAAKVDVLQASIIDWEKNSPWASRVLLSARAGRDYRLDDDWSSAGGALRLSYQTQYFSLFDRTVRMVPMFHLKGIEQHYQRFGVYRYLESNVGAKWYYGEWRWTQEVGAAERYDEVGVVLDTELKYQINSALSSYAFAAVFHGSEHESREMGVGMQWRWQPKWLLTLDVGQEDRLVDINRYSRERLEAQVYWRSDFTLSARYRHALSDDGYNEIYQRLIWPLTASWSVTQSLSWQQDSGWRLANALMGIQWRH